MEAGGVNVLEIEEQIKALNLEVEYRYFTDEERERNLLLGSRSKSLISSTISIEILTYFLLFFLAQLYEFLLYGSTIVTIVLIFRVNAIFQSKKIINSYTRSANYTSQETKTIAAISAINSSFLAITYYLMFLLLTLFYFIENNSFIFVAFLFMVVISLIRNFKRISEVKSIRANIKTQGIYFQNKELFAIDVIISRFATFGILKGRWEKSLLLSSASMKRAVESYPNDFGKYFFDLYDIIRTNTNQQAFSKYFIISGLTGIFSGVIYSVNHLRQESIYFIFALDLIIIITVIGLLNFKGTSGDLLKFEKGINVYFDELGLGKKEKISVLTNFHDYIMWHDYFLDNRLNNLNIIQKLVISFLSIAPTDRSKALLARIIHRSSDLYPLDM